MAKRYNVEALATGHHLDDEASTLLGNIITWNITYLIRKHPVLPERDGFVRKVKPLFRFYKKDIQYWAEVFSINPVQAKCPYGVNASLNDWMRLMNDIELTFPQTKLRFYLEYIERIQPILKERLESEIYQPEVKPCKICGEPAFNSDYCLLCKIKLKAEERAKEMARETEALG